MTEQSRTHCASDAASAEELLRSNELYRMLVECATDYAIFMLDADGVIRSWNSGAERLKGYREEEIVGKHFATLYTEPDIAQEYPQYELRMAAAQGRFEDEGWRVRKDGSRFWANVVITAIRNNAGELLGFGKITRDLTLRRAIELQLEASEQRYRSLFEHNPDPVYALDLEGRFTEANRPTLRLTGRSRAELIGINFHEVIAPEALEHTIAAFRAAVGGEPQLLETVLINRDGERRLLSVSAVPTFVDGRVAGVFGVAEDITERHRVQEERAELLEREQAARAEAEAAEDRARFLGEASRILAESLDYHATLRQVARLAVPRLGDYCLVDVVEEDGTITRMEVCHVEPEHEQLLRELQRSYPLDGTRPHPVLEVLKSGEPLFVPVVEGGQLAQIAHDARHLCTLESLQIRSFMCVPLKARGRILGALSFACTTGEQSYTRSVHLSLAEELAHRAAVGVDNARLYEAALVASRSKSDFLATMSHELRTPLNAIMGYTDLLAEEITGPVTEAQKKQLARIGQSSHHLLTLIDEVLSFSRMEAGREEVRVEEVELGALVREVTALVEPLANRKGLALDVHVPELPPLDTDPHKVRQILLNLLSNAVKFTDQGRISLHAENVDHTVMIRVSDTGIGIPDEHRERVFHPFHQVEQGASRRTGGTGLGLSITRHLVQLLGGEITLSTEPGHGTTFTVLLPVRVRSRPA